MRGRDEAISRYAGLLGRGQPAWTTDQIKVIEQRGALNDIGNFKTAETFSEAPA